MIMLDSSKELILNNAEQKASYAFTTKYLGLQIRVDPQTFTEEELIIGWEEMWRDYSNPDVNRDFVQHFVNKHYPKKESGPNPEYKEFLKKPYWAYLSTHVKRTINRCEFWYKHPKEHLEVHHRTYKIYGREMDGHLDDLVCLCHQCHNNNHRNDWKKNGSSNVDVQPEIGLETIHSMTEAINNNNLNGFDKEIENYLESTMPVKAKNTSILASALKFKEAAIILEAYYLNERKRKMNSA
jgi:hypothetical protein